ncbi:MAG TPA: S24 family peptidase [Alphaproteobacteria bacterium]|nr:S24 family peptidase [Alphaproteobacteria bacterium]
MANQSSVAVQLKRLRERANLSVREVAAAIEKPASTYASYEDKYKKSYLPVDLVKELIPVFTRRGITEEELYALAGLEHARRARARGRHGGGDDGRMATLMELDLRAGAGQVSMIDSERIAAEWHIPADLFRAQTSAPLSALRIITIYGDSMEPALAAGTRVVVDTTDRTPSPPGVFVVYDGLGLVVKRLEHIARSDPARVRLTSDNPKYQPYELTIDEAQIQGRVIGRWRWM